VARALRNQRFRLGRGAVVNREIVSSFEQIGGHGDSHIPQANESDFHGVVLAKDFLDWMRGGSIRTKSFFGLLTGWLL
jgi:hypothetical protein